MPQLRENHVRPPILRTVNKNGTPKNLKAAHPDNSNALKFGVYSPRALEARTQELMDALDASVGMRASDRIAVNEVCRLLALIDLIDEDLATRGVGRRNGEARSLVALRVRASGELRQWYIQLGVTAVSRNGIRSSNLVHTALVRATMISPKEFVQTLQDVTEITMSIVPDVLKPVLAERIMQYVQENRRNQA